MDEHAIIQHLIIDGVSENFLEHYANCPNCMFQGTDLDPGFYECSDFRPRIVKPKTKTATDVLITDMYKDMVLDQFKKETELMVRLFGQGPIELVSTGDSIVFEVRKESDGSTGDRDGDQE
jgi:hypothetical protein